MREFIVVEVRDGAEQLRERTRIVEFPATIGRAYLNAVIVDDPTVSDQHVELLAVNDGQILIRDLKSENGTKLLPSREPLTERTVPSGSAIQIGNSILRLYSSSHKVPPALPLSKRAHWFVKTLERPGIAVLLFAIYLVIGQSWDYWFSSAPELSENWLQSFFTKALASTLIAALWVGLWAIISSINLHRSRFAVHLSVLILAFFGVNLNLIISDYLHFSFASSRISLSFLILSSAGMTFWVIATHLRLSTQKPEATIRRIAATVSVGVIGIITAVMILEEQSFSDDIPSQLSIKPPAFKLAPSVSIDEFVSETHPLQAKLQREVPPYQRR